MAGSHGRFVWYELVTPDMDGAKAFYAQVVGWGTQDVSMPGMPYTVFTAGAASVTGLMSLSGEARARGAQPSWTGYVGVDNVEAAVARIKQLGGTVYVPPRDIGDVSRFSIVADPQRVTVALFSWLKPGVAPPLEPRKPGHVGWHELLAAEWETAWTFYSELFGWQAAGTEKSPTGPYRLFSAGGETIGGMFDKPEAVAAPIWLYYFNVGDINAAAQRVRAAGGQVLKGPVEVPGGNWIVHCADPQDAVFGLVGNNGIGFFERAPSKPPSP